MSDQLSSGATRRLLGLAIAFLTALCASIVVPGAVDAQEETPQKVVEVIVVTGQSNADKISIEYVEREIAISLSTNTDLDQFVVFKMGAGGTSLYDLWSANGTASPVGDGKTYKFFQNLWGRFYTDLVEQHPDAKIVISTLFWIQGEADSRSELGLDYVENLKVLIDDFRLTLPAPDLRIYTVRQTFIDRPGFPYSQEIRDAHTEIGDTLPLAYTVDVDIIPRDQVNGVHYTGRGYESMAEIFGKVYKQIELGYEYPCGEGFVNSGECVEIDVLAECDFGFSELVVSAESFAAEDHVLTVKVDGEPIELAVPEPAPTTEVPAASTGTDEVAGLVGSQQVKSFPLPDLGLGDHDVEVFASGALRFVENVDADDCAPEMVGDVDCDSQLSELDVRAVLGSHVGLAIMDTGCSAGAQVEAAACDVDGTRDCSLADALAIARCLVSPDPQSCWAPEPTPTPTAPPATPTAPAPTAPAATDPQ